MAAATRTFPLLAGNPSKHPRVQLAPQIARPRRASCSSKWRPWGLGLSLCVHLQRPTAHRLGDSRNEILVGYLICIWTSSQRLTPPPSWGSGSLGIRPEELQATRASQCPILTGEQNQPALEIQAADQPSTATSYVAQPCESPRSTTVGYSLIYSENPPVGTLRSMVSDVPSAGATADVCHELRAIHSPASS